MVGGNLFKEEIFSLWKKLEKKEIKTSPKNEWYGKNFSDG
jgi:hypothetical protein